MLYESNPRLAEEILRKDREQTEKRIPRLSNLRRKLNVPMIATITLSTTCAGVTVGLPMIQSLRQFEAYVRPPSITDRDAPSVVPLPSPSEQPVSQQPSLPEPSPVQIPTPVYIASVCETQEGTREGQLSSGEPILPATVDRPSIFVVSPDRSTEQSFSVRPAHDTTTDWYTISEGEDVGIIGILTSDTQFQTSDKRAVWGRSCEQTTAAAVEEVSSRVDDLCRRDELELRAVVVYHVGPDGKPVEMNRTDC